MTTNFKQVGEFHETFDHPLKTVPDKNVFDTDPKLVKLRLSLIEEEFKELLQAAQDKNIVEVADALTDILYVVYGAGHAFGIDLDETFRLVHQSNMTKACKDEKEAQETVDYIKDHNPEQTPAYKLASNEKYYIVYNERTGKILKNKNYKSVDLHYLENMS